jgi:hypothetical protein
VAEQKEQHAEKKAAKKAEKQAEREARSSDDPAKEAFSSAPREGESDA